jgi:hypothetical protein
MPGLVGRFLVLVSGKERLCGRQAAGCHRQSLSYQRSTISLLYSAISYFLFPLHEWPIRESEFLTADIPLPRTLSLSGNRWRVSLVFHSCAIDA